MMFLSCSRSCRAVAVPFCPSRKEPKTCQRGSPFGIPKVYAVPAKHKQPHASMWEYPPGVIEPFTYKPRRNVNGSFIFAAS